MNLVPDIAVLFDLDGRRKRLDYRKVPLMHWQQLEDRVGYTPATLMNGIQTSSVKAIVALIWLERSQREKRLSYQEVFQKVDQDNPQYELHDMIFKGRSLIGDDDDEADGEPDGADTGPPTGPS